MFRVMLNKEEILNRFKLKHGDKYEYEDFEYKYIEQKINIKCSQHGVFIQGINKHSIGRGCGKCGKSKRLTKDEFIEISNKANDFKYIYEKVNYVNNSTNVEIICPEHGSFFQKPGSHMKGIKGCKFCLGKVYTLEAFIEKSNKIHNDYYDYSLSIYNDNRQKLKIICPKHGIFEQSPNTHLSGAGCTQCSYEKTKYNQLSQEQVIERLNLVHKGFYDYRLVEYTTSYCKLKIICPKHGIFKQSYSTHLKCGCPKCKTSKGERKIENFLIENNIQYTRQKSFKDCRYKKALSFDFYLESKNICIEYDGSQHFKSFKFFGGEEKFKQTQLRDQIKNQYCQDNNIGLIRISYKEFDQIEEIINNSIWK